MSKKTSENIIILNKKARHDYFIEEQFEAGIMLEGWEVKSLRAGRVQLVDSYVILKNGAPWLLGALITPLMTASTHVHPDQTRTRKLLLHKKEISKLIGAVERKGYTVIATDLHWNGKNVKVNIAIAHGKQLHDKRAAERDKDWAREKSRLLKHG
jgi:SsrA-binding protein